MKLFKDINKGFKPKPKWLASILVITGIVVLGLIIWGGYKLFKPTSTEDELKDWRTYRNEIYGFEIKYPRGWLYYESNESPSSGYVMFEPIFDNNNRYLLVGVNDNKEKLPLLDFVNKQYSKQYSEQMGAASPPTEQNKIVINNYDAIRYDYSEGSFFYEHVYLFQDDKVYHFLREIYGNNKDLYLDIFNQMLSTFKPIKSTFEVISNMPVENSVVEKLSTIKITFNKDLDKNTIDADTFYVLHLCPSSRNRK